MYFMTTVEPKYNWKFLDFYVFKRLSNTEGNIHAQANILFAIFSSNLKVRKSSREP